MLRRRSLLFLLSHNQCGQLPMALPKGVLSAGYSSHVWPSQNSCKVNYLSSMYGSHGIQALNCRARSEQREGVFRRMAKDFSNHHAVSVNHHFVRDFNYGSQLDIAVQFLNGQSAPKKEWPDQFPNHPLPEKLAVAVDVDEVLGSFLSALNMFVADRYCSYHSVSEYYVYEFYKVWNCSRSEADLRVHEFFKTSYFKDGIHPIPGAQRVLANLSPFCDLSIVTSRQNVIKDHTLEWIEKHYPGLFNEIHFGNHFALDGHSKPKSDICRSLGAEVLIDDNPRYALECAEVGVKVLLFDYRNSYPWSKSDSADLHPLVTRVRNWEEVEEKLACWIVSH